jgi:hypothetical protein
MSGTHGDLFVEIGKTVLAAHAGQAIDLTEKSEELAQRYWNLGVPPETIAKAIARSLGAIGMSMAIVSRSDGPAAKTNGNGHTVAAGDDDVIRVNGKAGNGGDDAAMPDAAEPVEKSGPGLFPSGVRLAVLS